jgi:hypothetical protein
MLDQYKTLLEENNVISLRTAYVVDNGNLVGFQLMPAWLDSSIPRKRGLARKDFEWVLSDQSYLYRHMRSVTEEVELMSCFPCVEQAVKPMRFESPPELRLLWADSGNTVALYLNGEPWAFIDEETHKGYSKGVLKPAAPLPAMGNQWDQELFEKLFITK